MQVPSLGTVSDPTDLTWAPFPNSPSKSHLGEVFMNHMDQLNQYFVGQMLP